MLYTFAKKLTLGALIAAGVCMHGTASAQAVQPRTMKFGHFSTAESPLGAGAYKFADLVGQKSGGKIQVKIFNSGQLGNEVQQIGATQGGTQDFFLVSSSPLVSLVKDLQVLDIPGLMTSTAEADKLLDGPIGQKMLAKLQDKKLVGLSYWENGFRQFSNSKKRILKVEDISGLKVRVIQNPIYIDLFRQLGANAVPMSFNELYSALETKTVDAQDNALATFYNSKLYEVQKHLTLTRHIYNPMVVVGSQKVWESLSTDEKKILTDAMAEARDFQRKLNREKEAAYVTELKAKGIVIDELPAAEGTKLRTQLKPVADKYAKEIGEEWVKEAFGEVERIRGQK